MYDTIEVNIIPEDQNTLDNVIKRPLLSFGEIYVI